MNSVLIQLITSYSLMHGVDPNIVAAVISYESSFNEKAVGGVGEIGLMQLRPEYFSDSCVNVTKEKTSPKDVVCGHELFDPEINLSIGIKHLADLQQRCKHKEDGMFVICHNVGVVGGSRIKSPSNFGYYKAVRERYEEIIIAGHFSPKLPTLELGSVFELSNYVELNP